jgi:methoxylated aromatic compound---corrinoid protein Co-methyltransferase
MASTVAASSFEGDKAELYRHRLHRYVTTMRNGQADRVPIRPFLAEFCGRYAGYDCMQVTHDRDLAFEAVRRVAADFDCDALVGNMVYVWTGLTQALGLKYYGTPGIDCPADHGFQYIEPPRDKAWMKPEEYDHLIEDPTGYLYSVWLPRVSGEIGSGGEGASYRGTVALVKSAMAMWDYFLAFGTQAERMRAECAMPGALCGILKAPLDILADKLRGYLGLVQDLRNQPDKVLRACQALAPHLAHVAQASADPEKLLPIGHWMHRSCVPFVTPDHFREIHWPTLRPIVESLWAAGHQTLFYAEGDWDAHLNAFAELPAGSIIYHVDQGEIAAADYCLGERFCISGGVPNTLLSMGSPDQIRARCRKVIECVGRDGGYILDASAIVQNDAKVENVMAMLEAGREFGSYGGEPCADAPGPFGPEPGYVPTDMSNWSTERLPGVCVPWQEKVAELPFLRARPDLAQRIWENLDEFGYAFIWHCLVSF